MRRDRTPDLSRRRAPLRLVAGKKLQADLRSSRTSYSREPLLGSHVAELCVGALGSHVGVDISPLH